MVHLIAFKKAGRWYKCLVLRLVWDFIFPEADQTDEFQAYLALYLPHHAEKDLLGILSRVKVIMIKVSPISADRVVDQLGI